MLLFGVALRCAQLNEPILDAHTIRQTQTADWTYNAMQEGKLLPLSAPVSWRGNTGARLLLEFPLYNYPTIFLARAGVPLEVAGRIVSILFWAASFLTLQMIWRFLLTQQQMLYANLLFVVAPLSVVFGEAFMPEMVILFLSLQMVWHLLRYYNNPSSAAFWGFTFFGLIGLMVKSLEVFHLYILALFVFYSKHRMAILKQIPFWIGGLLTLTCFYQWLQLVNSVNQQGLPEWGSGNLVELFIGPLEDRLNFRFYLKVLAYITVFILSPFGLALSILALYKRDLPIFFKFWLFSLPFFYLLFGPITAGQHNYYNLPVLGPACALFGIGMIHLLSTNKRGVLILGRIAAVATVLFCFAGSAYLFKQDKVIPVVAESIRLFTKPDDIIVAKLAHRIDSISYHGYPALSYYSKRPTWIIAVTTTDEFEANALKTATWAVITQPEPEAPGLKLREFLGQYGRPAIITNWPPSKAGFIPVISNQTFVLFKKLP